MRDPPYESTNQLSRGQRDFKSGCLENFTTREYNRRSVGVVRLVSTLHDSYGSYETALRVVRLNLRLVNTLDDQYGSYVHVSYDDLFLKKKNSLKES